MPSDAINDEKSILVVEKDRMELICVLKITLNAMAELEENNDACVNMRMIC